MKISAIMWVFDIVWVMYAKSLFLHGPDVLIKMFANSLTVLNQQTHLSESVYLSIFVVGARRGTC